MLDSYILKFQYTCYFTHLYLKYHCQTQRQRQRLDRAKQICTNKTEHTLPCSKFDYLKVYTTIVRYPTP